MYDTSLASGFLIQSILFSNLIYAEQLSLPAADVSAPEVEHEPISGPLPTGAAHQIKATVKDNVGVDGVSLFYRRLGESQYQRKAMLREAQDSDIFSITLGAKVLSAPGIEYYIQATDLAGNSVLYGYSFEPIKLSVVSDSQATTAENDSTFDEVSNADPKEKKKGSLPWALLLPRPVVAEVAIVVVNQAGEIRVLLQLVDRCHNKLHFKFFLFNSG